MKTWFYLLGLFLLSISCEYKDIPKEAIANKELTGTWTIEQIYANDFWGGPLSWKNTNWGKQIKFTVDHKYYEKTNNDFELVGTLKVISDDQIEITWDQSIITRLPAYQVHFEFDAKGLLTVSTGSFEGIVSEKYKSTEKL